MATSDDGKVVYAGDIIGALDACQLCPEGLAAPGSRYCAACERENLAFAIDRAARRDEWDREPLLYRTARRERDAAAFWQIVVVFAAGVVTLVALWEGLIWMR